MLVRRLCALAISVLALAGCTSLTKEYVAPPPSEKVSLIAIGAIEPSRTEWERDALHFKRSLHAELRTLGTFPDVRPSIPRTLPADALVISGTIEDADGGSDLEQALLGIGGPRAEVEVRVSDSQDRVLFVFSQSSLMSRKFADVRSWTPVEVGDLMEDLAAAAARSVARWSKGEEVSDTLF